MILWADVDVNVRTSDVEMGSGKTGVDVEYCSNLDQARRYERPSFDVL